MINFRASQPHAVAAQAQKGFEGKFRAGLEGFLQFDMGLLRRLRGAVKFLLNHAQRGVDMKNHFQSVKRGRVKIHITGVAPAPLGQMGQVGHFFPHATAMGTDDVPGEF